MRMLLDITGHSLRNEIRSDIIRDESEVQVVLNKNIFIVASLNGTISDFTEEELLDIVKNDPEYKCLFETYAEHLAEDPVVGGCPVFYDTVLCWPPTWPATLAVLPCFKEFQGVQYNNINNATRYCHLNGIWDNYTDYEQCMLIHDTPEISEFHPIVELPTIIYGAGYLLSLITLSLALAVFLYFKDLRCLRNTIHANLFLTYILSAILWILTLTLQIFAKPSLTGCIFLVILYHYFSLTNFFWMLVEGLYLYMLVVETFSGDNLKFKMYAFIGWGFPAIIVAVWAVAKIFFPDVELELSNELQLDCNWMHDSHVDWIYEGPSCICLIINLYFLIRIMWVLIIKLRSTNSAETQQYRKASKALLVLLPLLGITYLIFLTAPTDGFFSFIFAVLRALLISTQGFSVALFYCFLNSEVKVAIRYRVIRWRDAKNIRLGTSSSKKERLNLSSSKEYSPRSATESIRLTSTSPVP